MKTDQIIDSKIKTMTDLSGKKSKMLLLKDETEIEAFKQQLRLHNVSQQRELFDKFYKWLDYMSEAEYDKMSLTEKCEKFFFSE